jgi:aminopeptidase N
LQGNQNASLGAEAQLGKKPIVAANNYTANIYPRGSTVLNMMRHILGDDGWWKTIHHYLDVHQFNNVEANDLKVAAEEATGQNLDWFFDQWIYKSGHPIYDVSYIYDAESKLVRMKVVQLQDRDSMTSTFKMPIEVELTMPDGLRHVETIRNFDSSQTFTFVAPQKPLNVIFDKGNTILKELRIQKSPEEWVYQLQHSLEAIERSEAAQALGSRSYAGLPSVINALAHTVSSDSFWASRMYALTALAVVSDSLKTYEQLVQTTASHDPNPDVRQNAVGLSLRMANHASAETIATAALLDSSYRIHGNAIRVLYRLDPAAGTTAAIQALGQKSPRDNLRYASVEVLSESKTESGLDRLIAMIGERNVPKNSRWNIIDAIGDNAQVDSAKVFTVLWNLTHNGDRDIRVTALNNLANHGGEATRLALQSARSEHSDMKEFFDELDKRMQTRLTKERNATGAATLPR